MLVARSTGMWWLTTEEARRTTRIAGAVEQVGGMIKKGVGSLIGNQQMEAEGQAAELSGEAKQASAKAAERVAVLRVAGLRSVALLRPARSRSDLGGARRCAARIRGSHLRSAARR